MAVKLKLSSCFGSVTVSCFLRPLQTKQLPQAMMAQAPLRMDPDQFSCSICLMLLKDPVTIPCGHSYCMSCLTQYWDRQRVCSCPQCRATFSPRPTLGRNTLLVEMLQTLKLSLVPSAPPLYEDHGFDHATFDVSSVRPERTDGQRLLENTRRHLAEQIKESDQELQQLNVCPMKDSSRIFVELLEFLERRRVEVKELIRVQEKAEVARAENQLQRLEQHVSELRRRDSELERLHQSQDQHLITQMCQSYRSPASAGAPGSLTVSPHVSFGPVRRAVSDLKQQLQTLYHREFPTITSVVKSVNILQIKKANMAIPADMPDLDSRSSLLQNFVSLSLDPFTAHRELSLTDGNRAVSRTGQLHSYPDHPDRFDSWGQVLCREGLEGRSYWEAEWTGQQVGLGLTYESIGRKGSSNDCRLGHNSLSWGLSCSASSFTFCHGNESQALATPSSSVSNRIGVFVDFEAGMILFYMATPRGVHLLHSLKTHLTQPLYPAVWLGANSTVTFCAVD
ncbi:E3 ubiquitin-protein ligase TRIM65-like [Solea solea]|uniref:E3 ubiquitin-protein ligase TRIM65-like n=1 Tax=Solea solea TaxID=90069 RepID=UPI00272AE099|nr:E3 ubiquitin-protein ligase TRIM65-like [Solea solea]